MNNFPSSLHPAIWNKMILANSTESLESLSNSQPVLLVFLRFFGCSFCREAMSDISKKRKVFEKKGIKVVFVHMAPEEDIAEKYFKRYKLLPTDHILDPEKKYYKAFGLIEVKGTQLLSFMTFVRGFQAVVVEGHGTNLPSADLGDGFQMPGVFLLHKGEVLNSFVHKKEYDRPDYEEIVASCGI